MLSGLISGDYLGWHSKVLIEVQIRGAGGKFLFLL